VGKKLLNSRTAPLVAGLVTLCISATEAQTFFGTLGVENAIGVERGSTALVEPVDKATTILTLDSYGSEEVGPWVTSLTFAIPKVLGSTDQWDLTAVVGGPGEERSTELRAAGFGYRVRPWDDDTTLYVSASYSDVRPDGSLTRDLSIEGDQRRIAFGARREIRTEDVTTTVTFEARVRDNEATSMGVPIQDERIGALFLGVRRSSGRPLGLQTRIGAAVSAGTAEYGDSALFGPLSSAPGADDRFLRASASTEASVPLSRLLALNAGLVGQWSDASLPLSQRCGFGTNAYSRGFDQSELLGDLCIAGRAELAANAFLPVGEEQPAWLQIYAGVDGGHLRNNATRLADAATAEWSSGSIGVRAVGRDWIAELSATTVIDAPRVAVADAGDARVWFRAGLRF